MSAYVPTRKSTTPSSLTFPPRVLLALCCVSAIVNLILDIGAGVLLIGSHDVFAGQSFIDNLGGFAALNNIYVVVLPSYIRYKYLAGKYDRSMIVIFVFLIGVRSVVLDERVALVELGMVVLLCAYVASDVLISRVMSLGLFVFGIPVFLIVFLARLPPWIINQDSATIFEKAYFVLSSTTVYYADTSNKLYYVLFFNDPPLFDQHSFLQPILRVFARFVTNESYNNILNPSGMRALGASHEYMTNPGGPAQDAADFSYAFVLIAAFKAWLLGLAYRGLRAMKPFSIAVYPIVLMLMLEYPRFNYIYENRGFIPFTVLCLMACLAPTQSFGGPGTGILAQQTAGSTRSQLKRHVSG